MELAVVSHRSGAAPMDSDLTAQRLAGHGWTAVCADMMGLAVAAELAAALEIDLTIFERFDLSQVIDGHPGGRVVAICDARTTREFVAATLDVPVEVIPLPAALSVTCVRANRRGIRSVISLNDTLHLQNNDSHEEPETIPAQGFIPTSKGAGGHE